jgi:hypothetical protein
VKNIFLKFHKTDEFYSISANYFKRLISCVCICVLGTSKVVVFSLSTCRNLQRPSAKSEQIFMEFLCRYGRHNAIHSG